MSAGTVMILSCGWVALSVICGMLAEYGGRITAALLFEPMPSPRFREGQPVKDERR